MQTRSEEDAAMFRETMKDMAASYRVMSEAQSKSAEASIEIAKAMKELVKLKSQKLQLLERTTHSWEMRHTNETEIGNIIVEN